MEVETDGDWAFVCRLKLGQDVLGFQPGKFEDIRVLMMSYIPNYQGPLDFQRCQPFSFMNEQEVDDLIERLRQWRWQAFEPPESEKPGLVAEFIVDQARRGKLPDS